jgi:hypothetical protein
MTLKITRNKEICIFKGTVQRDGSCQNYVHSKGLFTVYKREAQRVVLLHVKIPLPLVQVLVIRILIDNGAHSSVCALLAMAL